jgi:hypothetical protein
MLPLVVLSMLGLLSSIQQQMSCKAVLMQRMAQQTA